MFHEKSIRRAFSAVSWLLAALIFLRVLFVPLLPFLLSLSLSALLEPWVQRLRRAMNVRRSFAAVVVTTATLIFLGGGALLLVLRLGQELSEWSRRLPQAIDAFPGIWNNTLDRLEGWYITCPQFLRTFLDEIAAALEKNTPTLIGRLGGILMEKLSALAAVLPGIGLFCITTILALYFTSVNYNVILAFIKRQLPDHWQSRCRSAAQCLRSAILKWLRSELLLILVTFLIVLLGLSWLKYDFALLAACFIALIDALPVLGAGTILIPWASACLLLGKTEQGLALGLLYAFALLVHSLLEPRLLAGQGGIPSIAILLAMYLGYHFFGIPGMIFLPLLLLLLKQLQDAGVVTIWH